MKIGHIGEEIVVTEEFYLNHLSPESKKEWNDGMRQFIKKRADFKENNPVK